MFPYPFALMVIIMGEFFISARSYDSHRLRKSWLCTEGIVYACRGGVKRDSNGEKFSERWVKCMYKVGGVAQTIILENSEFWNSSQRKCETVSRHLPSGFTLSVHYGPKNLGHAFDKPLETSAT
jgi:hypothetical protein